MTMLASTRNLINAIRAGDLKTIRSLLGEASTGELQDLLGTRYDGSVYMRRPSTGKEVRVDQPTPLMVAVCDWYVDVVEYLVSYRLDLDDTVSAQDITNSPNLCTGVTAMHLAAISGKLDMVRHLVAGGANVNAQTSLGDTPLFEACFEGHATIVQYLLENGGDPETSNNKKTTCLMIAAYADNDDVIKRLTHNGVNVERRDRDGRNVLFYSASGGRPDTFDYLIRNGAKVHPDPNGVTILMEATHQGQLDIIKYLLEDRTEPPVSPNAKDANGQNVFFYCVDHQRIAIFEYYVNYGIAFEPSDDGRTPLMVATLNSNTKMVSYLIEHADQLGIDIKAKDNRGRNALFYSITGDDEDMLKYLISAGIPMEASAEGISTLMQSVAKYRYDITSFLLSNSKEYDIDISEQDKDGWSALMYSAAGGHQDMFELLVENGATCLPATDGRTVLMQAAAAGDVSLLRHILDNAASLEVYMNAKDKDGWNALFFTIGGSHIEAFKFLVKRGVKMCTTVKGTTPLMKAADQGKRVMVECLTKMATTLDLDLNHRDRDGANALFYCVTGGHLNLLKFLLNAGCEVSLDDHGRNLLMQAALSGHLTMVQFLVQEANRLSIDIHQVDNNGRNALFYSVERDHPPILEYLLSCGISPVVDKHGRSLLMHAAHIGSYRLVEYILHHEHHVTADLNHKDVNGENAIFYAVRSQHLKIINLLIEKEIELTINNVGVNVISQCMSDGKDDIVATILNSDVDLSRTVQGVDTKGRSIFHHCVVKGDVEMLQRLGHYYDCSTDGDHEGVTVLMRACQQTDINIIKYLVEVMKVDYQKCDIRNRTALLYAVESSNFAAVEFLLNLYTDLGTDDEGKSVLVYTVISGDIKLTSFLLNSKFGQTLLMTRDKQLRTVCHYAAQLGRDFILTLLHKHNCQKGLVDVAGTTPLMCACANSHASTACLLLRHGAEVDALDNHHRCALHYCFDNPPSLKCVKVLLHYDADPNEADDHGVTPLMLACGTCTQTNIPVISLLLEHGGDPVYQDNDGKDAFDYCPFTASYVKAMMRRKGELEEHQKAAMAMYRARLHDDLEMNSVLRGLLRKKAFTKTLNFEVMKRPASERVEKLLELLRTRGQFAFRTFCLVLKAEGEQELSYCLQKAAYKRDYEVYI